MDLLTIVGPDGLIPRLRATSKKQALQQMAALIAPRLGQEERIVFDVLMERERLGSTGVGNGIAIPHGKLKGVERMHGLLALCERPIGFDAVDDQPVDIIFLLMAPENAGAEHLRALAQVSRLLRDTCVVEKLHQAESADDMRRVLVQRTRSEAA